MAVPANNWHNKPDYDVAVAGVLFVTPEGWLILHHRDGNTPFSPNLLSVFGGLMEPEDTSPAAAAAREASEETNRIVTEADLVPFMEHTFDIRPDRRERFFLFALPNQTTEGLEIYEGQGYKLVKSADDPLIAPAVQAPVSKWFKEHPPRD